MHRHPYPEIFVIEAGQATFVVDGVETVVEGRKMVVAPSNSWHGFTNTGAAELRLTAISTAPVFDTAGPRRRSDVGFRSARTQAVIFYVSLGSGA